MENNLIIERLKATIEKLKQLEPNKFYYGNFVTESNGGCGTVCCVAGWYPEWFPESGLKWQVFNNDMCAQMRNSIEVNELLLKYHGLGREFIGALFYGDVCNLTEFYLPWIPSTATKETVLTRFEKTLQFIENGGIELIKD
jgi:hypothetical protein